MKLSIFFYLLLFVVGVISQDVIASEPKVLCPQNSLYGEDTTKFTITAPPSVLYPHLGDFYSPSWPKLLCPPDTFTFTPPTRTTTFNAGNTTLTEYLLTNASTPDTGAFMLRWELASDPFSPTGRFDIAYYQMSVHVFPVCTGGLLASVAWRTRACVYGDPGLGMAWFVERQRRIVRNIWAGVADGWMGGPESSVGNCYGLNATDTETETESGSKTEAPGPGGVVIYTPVPELNSRGAKTRGVGGLLVAAGLVAVLAAGYLG